MEVMVAAVVEVAAATLVVGNSALSRRRHHLPQQLESCPLSKVAVGAVAEVAGAVVELAVVGQAP